jgi:hypothetical protein
MNRPTTGAAHSIADSFGRQRRILTQMGETATSSRRMCPIDHAVCPGGYRAPSGPWPGGHGQTPLLRGGVEQAGHGSAGQDGLPLSVGGRSSAPRLRPRGSRTGAPQSAGTRTAYPERPARRVPAHSPGERLCNVLDAMATWATSVPGPTPRSARPVSRHPRRRPRIAGRRRTATPPRSDHPRSARGRRRPAPPRRRRACR